MPNAQKNIHARPAATVLFVLLFAFSGLAHAAASCEAVTARTQDLAKRLDLDQVSPALARMLTNGIVSRALDRQSDNWNALEETLENCTAKACDVQLRTDEFMFMGSVKIAEEDGEKVLELAVGYFSAGRAGPFKNDLWIGQRPRGLNQQFSKLIGVIFSTLFEVMARNPEIHHVRIKGSTVVNATLASMLKKMGFRQSYDLSSTYEINGLKAAGLAGVKAMTILGALLTGHSYSIAANLPFFLATKSLAKPTAAGLSYKMIPPADWYLDLTVNSPQLEATIDLDSEN